MFDVLGKRKRFIALVVFGVSVVVGGGGLVLHFSDTHQNERESMLAIGAAAHQWQVFYGDNVCPSVRQLVQGKYLVATTRNVDSWEQPFSITCLEFEIVVTSFGPDRKPGTADDITVSERRSK
jgi:hypothetical protein